MFVSEEAREKFQARKPKPTNRDANARGLLLAPMSQVFFSDKDQDLSCYRRGLEGPAGPMLLLPEDILRGRQVLKEPYPRRKVQAWKHQAILVIGQRIEEQFLAAFAKKCAEEIKAKEEEMLAAMRKAIEEEVKKAKKATKRQMDHTFRDKLREFIKLQTEYVLERDQKLCSRFEVHLKKTLETTRQEMREEQDLAVQKERQICMEEADFIRRKEIHDIKMVHAKEMGAARLMIEFLQAGILPKQLQDTNRDCVVRK